jgi:hypothetical protein
MASAPNIPHSAYVCTRFLAVRGASLYCITLGASLVPGARITASALCRDALELFSGLGRIVGAVVVKHDMHSSGLLLKF